MRNAKVGSSILPWGIVVFTFFFFFHAEKIQQLLPYFYSNKLSLSICSEFFLLVPCHVPWPSYPDIRHEARYYAMPHY